ncbi:MAG TPA: DUF2059 domain-containing protein [Sphingobium sp.]|uniref:DUF2059 domain-containing protein n=1 Tax=Sphingobium sp. TaxID=1912891 RepID=UPI002ED22AAC
MIAALALLAAAAAPTAAPVAVAPSAPVAMAQPDAATLAAARALMKISDLQGQMKALGPSMANAAEQQMRGMFTEARMPDGLQAQMASAMKSYLDSMDRMFTPELIDQMATIYARHFTAAELNHITAMMADPVMVHFRETTPQLMGELMPAMMQAMRPHQKALQAQLMTIIRDWIQTHPEDKAKLRSPLSS